MLFNSQDQSSPAETAPLLPSQQRATPTSALWDRAQPLPLYIRVSACVFLITLAGQLPTLSAIEVIKELLCFVWFTRNDPERLPSEGNLPTEMCSEPGPARALSIFLSVQTLLVSFFTFILSSLVAQYSSRIGRKPFLLAILFGQVTKISCFLLALLLHSRVPAALLFLGYLLFELIFGANGVILLGNMMVTDVTVPETRTTALSVVAGSFAAGASISFITGGTITTMTGSPVVACVLALCVGVASIVTALFLPETFGQEKINRAQVERVERAHQARAHSLERWLAEEGDRTRGPRRAVRKTAQGVLSVFEPLTRLRPTRNTTTGRFNFRLLNLALGSFIAAISAGYLSPAILTYMFAVLHFNQQDNGEVLSMLTASQTLGLMFLIPTVVKWGRPLYARFHRSSPRPSDDPLDDSRSEATSSHFDVWLLSVSLIIDALIIATFGLARTKWQLMLVSGLIAFGSGGRPSLQSVAAASVEPVVSGEILSAISMIQAIAALTSPILLGYFASRTVSSRPSAIFFVMGALLFVSGLLVLLIRDEDRYIPPSPGNNNDANGPEAGVQSS